MSTAAFRALLEAGDVDGLRRAWAQVASHLPQPETRDQAEIVMHHARTTSSSVRFRYRAWSHRWLVERSLPSGLPDELKPQAEKVEPRIAEGVGIVVRSGNPDMQPVADEVRKAMEVAVEDAYADRRTDPVFIKARMEEARAKSYRSLIGR